MGIHFCRDKPAHFQNTRRSCRSSYLCSLYGGFPAALRKIRRQDPAGSVHERKLHSLHPFLFMYFHPSISCAEPFGMCVLRILRWNYVAGTFQHRIRLYSTWRHNNVCPPCTCRRSGMFRWPDACRSGIFLRRRQSENRDFRIHYFSGRPAPWSDKIKKI